MSNFGAPAAQQLDVDGDGLRWFFMLEELMDILGGIYLYRKECYFFESKNNVLGIHG